MTSLLAGHPRRIVTRFSLNTAMVGSAILLLASVGTGTACTLPQAVQGSWDVRETSSGVSSGQFFLNMGSSGIEEVTFWGKTLPFNCYFQRDNYYVFVSGTTDLFNDYDVKLYFCWYLEPLTATSYRLYPLTDKVLYTVEERARAFLNTSSPDVPDICEIPLNSAPFSMEMTSVKSP